MITITESAQEYLVNLLSKQGEDVIGVRIFITNPGTPKAETCIAYCRREDFRNDDVTADYTGFKAYFEARSVPFLSDAVVDFSSDRMGGQLTIKAPNAKRPQVGAESSVEDRINYVLYSEVNPGLASHGGEVSLVEITEEMVAVLRFGGGCQGCGMVDSTLKYGVEKTLLDQVPELTGVRDVTDHTDKSQAYYAG